MIVTIDHGVALLEPYDMKGLRVESAVEDGDLASALADSGAGRLASADEAELSVAWLRSQVAEALANTESEWQRAFDDMVIYAQARGWLSPDGTHVRAHVEAV